MEYLSLIIICSGVLINMTIIVHILSKINSNLESMRDK